ncbi:MAG TPA: hypothetical protein VK638_30355 [Edaphobacter sp.]|nr:hypothetical protein [Edaphobacter sp.]
MAVRLDLSLLSAGNFLAHACLDESHRPMNVLIVNWETLMLPAVQPEYPPDRATLRKAIQKSFKFLIFLPAPSILLYAPRSSGEPFSP